MKLIIDIDKDDYEYMKNKYVPHTFNIFSFINNSIPIYDNATNGDVIRTLFKPNHVKRTDDNVIVENYDFDKEWWNSLYKG